MMKGYLTVYLSLSLTIILTFLLTLIEGARINTIRMEAECAADIGMNSVLAEFHRELLEQYELFFVDMSYGTEHAKIENTEEHLRSYIQKNFEPSGFFRKTANFLSMNVDDALLTEYILASDYEGNVMKRQALTYMEKSSPEGFINKVIGNISEASGLSLNERDVEGERNSIQSQIDAIELPKWEGTDGEMKEIELNNPADKINAVRSRNIMDLILSKGMEISGAAINESEYISHRTKNRGIGSNPDFKPPEGMTDKIVFHEYLLQKCGRYGNILDKSRLKYQIEYIIAGRGSDRENMREIAGKLLSLREAANVAYILSDSVKCAEAKALALTLTAVLQVPALAEPVKYSILFAWAFIESVYDVRTILEGGKVPFMKTSADWKTGINMVKEYTGNLPEADKGGRGAEYIDYLRFLLFLQEEPLINMRAMDIMEMDIRNTKGNEFFCIDTCIESFLADIKIASGFGYQCEINKRYGYH